ncbi:hypothetical protein LIER_37116 [Lithospermum erythrorhizon]|uniref:Transmembrane protein n=1 Tax=Lithospermum erythrorhizon TaxID=34254 RepID=A0AAV3PFK4_LITER
MLEFYLSEGAALGCFGVGSCWWLWGGVRKIGDGEDKVIPCRFWKWIDDSVPPLVCHAMDMNMKKSEKKAKLLGVVALLVCSAVIFFLFMGRHCDECKCSRNFGMYEITAPQM